MYPRLFFAKSLLKDDGVIFVSIDDHEVHNLRKIMDEIFGEENFVANIVWQHSVQPKGYLEKFSMHHNYLLCYQKSDLFTLESLERTEEHNKNYSNPDNDPNGPWRSGDVRNALYRPNLIFDIITPSGKVIKPSKNGCPTVADICIERLKRVSEEYKKEEQQKLTENDQDFGFKVFRLDKSNFNLKDEFGISEEEDVEELKRKYLDWLGLWINEPLVGDWKPIDIVYEIMLKEGFDLNSKIEQMRIKENKFFHVVDEKQELGFHMSLDEKIVEETIEEIRTSKYRDKVFVFLDKALTDNDKINLSAFVRLKVI